MTAHKKDNALRLALEALQGCMPTDAVAVRRKRNAIAAIQEALPHLEQKSDSLPSTGYVRQWQLIRNPKRPDFVAPVPVSSATLWRWVNAGKFPAPHKLSEGITAWKVDEVRAWMQEPRDGGTDQRL